MVVGKANESFEGTPSTVFKGLRLSDELSVILAFYLSMRQNGVVHWPVFGQRRNIHCIVALSGCYMSLDHVREVNSP
jgi:hypothetical protein